MFRSYWGKKYVEVIWLQWCTRRGRPSWQHPHEPRAEHMSVIISWRHINLLRPLLTPNCPDCLVTFGLLKLMVSTYLYLSQSNLRLSHNHLYLSLSFLLSSSYLCLRFSYLCLLFIHLSLSFSYLWLTFYSLLPTLWVTVQQQQQHVSLVSAQHYSGPSKSHRLSMCWDYDLYVART